MLGRIPSIDFADFLSAIEASPCLQLTPHSARVRRPSSFYGRKRYFRFPPFSFHFHSPSPILPLAIPLPISLSGFLETSEFPAGIKGWIFTVFKSRTQGSVDNGPVPPQEQHEGQFAIAPLPAADAVSTDNRVLSPSRNFPPRIPPSPVGGSARPAATRNAGGTSP